MFCLAGIGDGTEAEVAVQGVGWLLLEEREGHTDPASFSELLLLFVLNFVKISFWYRKICVILLNPSNL